MLYTWRGDGIEARLICVCVWGGASLFKLVSENTFAEILQYVDYGHIKEIGFVLGLYERGCH